MEIITRCVREPHDQHQSSVQSVLTKVFSDLPPAQGRLRHRDVPDTVVVEHRHPQVPDDPGPGDQHLEEAFTIQ